MSFKEKVHTAFIELLNNKITQLQKALFDLYESAKNETKSTAGDKHETALAMLQIEQENIRRQLRETQQQKTIFDGIDPLLSHAEIRKGSLIKTNKNWFFISAGIGKIKLEDKIIIALSPLSPLGLKLMGKRLNESIMMNAAEYKIESIE